MELYRTTHEVFNFVKSQEKNNSELIYILYPESDKIMYIIH